MSEEFLMVRNIAISFVLLALAGCKVAVIVVEGGQVLFGDTTGTGEVRILSMAGLCRNGPQRAVL